MSNVPKLRFSGFSGEWESNTFGGIATFINGKAYKQEELLEKGKYRVLRVGNFFSNKEWYYSNLELEENKYCDNGDLLYAWSASFGPRIWQEEKVIYHYHIWKVVENKETNKGFLFILLGHETERMKAQSANGLGLLHITKGAIEEWKCHIPKSKEQQKIANFLSSIDQVITAQAQKLDTLKAHKKGLMQQLFPAEGETTPKLRFPEFRDAGDWEEKPLKKVFSIFQGFAFSSIDSVTEGTRWLKIADVSIQEMNHNTPSYLPTEYKGKYKKFLVKQGDYVIALTRPILSKQLKIASVDGVFHNALLNQRVGKVVTTQNISFVYFLLQTSQLISNIETGISGSEPPNLSAKQIENINTLIPSEIEQEKIASCLSSIDDLISMQTKKIETLKAHKKGLMQQLFPSYYEITNS